MSTPSNNRVAIHKSFNIPTFARQEDSLGLSLQDLPKVISTSQTFEFEMSAGNGLTRSIVGTVGDVFIVEDAEGTITDVLVTASPTWKISPQADVWPGPCYIPVQISLRTCTAMRQMYIDLQQSKERSNCPITSTQFTFTINGLQIETDDYHFVKIVYRDTKAVTTRDGAPVSSVFGYITDIAANIISVACIEIVRGSASYYITEIPVDNLIGIFRYKAIVTAFIPKPQRDADRSKNTKSATPKVSAPPKVETSKPVTDIPADTDSVVTELVDEDGDILPTDNTEVPV